MSWNILPRNNRTNWDRKFDFDSKSVFLNWMEICSDVRRSMNRVHGSHFEAWLIFHLHIHSKRKYVAIPCPMPWIGNYENFLLKFYLEIKLCPWKFYIVQVCFDTLNDICDILQITFTRWSLAIGFLVVRMHARQLWNFTEDGFRLYLVTNVMKLQWKYSYCFVST